MTIQTPETRIQIHDPSASAPAPQAPPHDGRTAHANSSDVSLRLCVRLHGRCASLSTLHSSPLPRVHCHTLHKARPFCYSLLTALTSHSHTYTHMYTHCTHTHTYNTSCSHIHPARVITNNYYQYNSLCTFTFIDQDPQALICNAEFIESKTESW